MPSSHVGNSPAVTLRATMGLEAHMGKCDVTSNLGRPRNGLERDAVESYRELQSAEKAFEPGLRLPETYFLARIAPREQVSVRNPRRSGGSFQGSSAGSLLFSAQELGFGLCLLCLRRLAH